LKEALISHGLFDAEWYTSKYSDVLTGELDPIDHFVRYGEKLLRSPHPLFDTKWYTEQYKHELSEGYSPLLHYLDFGCAGYFDPSPYFSSSFYLANTPDATASNANPLVSFLAFWAEHSGSAARAALGSRRDDRRGDPHPFFDVRWYLTRYEELVPVDVNPLSFHVTTGHLRDCDPHPLIDCQWYRRAYQQRSSSPCVWRDYLSTSFEEVRSPSPLFDRQWYLDTYRDEYDVRVDPLIDYIVGGRMAGRLPHPMFASDWYVRQHPSAADYPGGPLCHFREVGSAKGADPHPLFSTRFFVEKHPESRFERCGPIAYYLLAPTKEFLQPHQLFDPHWYVACNPEAETAPVRPLVHLLSYGILENRDPHPLFDTKWYLEAYPNTRQALIHPLAHYLETGSALNYWPTSFFDPEFYAARYPECGGTEPLIHFACDGMKMGYVTNADAEEHFLSPLAPDVYNAGPSTFARYVRAIGCTARIVLACDAVKKSPVAYSYYFAYLLAEANRFPLPTIGAETPVISVILPTYNGIHFTLASITSASRFLPHVSFELIVADNVSTDLTQEVLEHRNDIRYIRHPENLGFLRSCNRAARFARGEFVFLLNNDTLVAPGWLDELYAQFFLHDNVGMTGSKLIYPDGRLQEAGGIIWKDGSAWNYGKFKDPGDPEFNYVRETDYCSGAAIMLPKRLWDEIGGFDEMYVPSYCEDSDLALRVRSLGYSVLYCHLSVVSHFEGMTQGRDTSSGIKSYQVSNTEKLLARWRPMISQYQPNGEQLDFAKDRGYFRRVLVLDECTPAPREDAGSVTALNLMRLFQSRGYVVTFIPRSNYLYVNELTQDLQRDGIEAIYGHYENSLQEHLQRHGRRYDVIMMIRPQVYENHVKEITQYAPQAKLIYHTCDLHYVRMAAEAKIKKDPKIDEMAKRFKVIEHDALKRADASIVHSIAEFELLKSELPSVEKVHIFGWAIPVATHAQTYDGRSGAIFVGGFNHQPNVDAVLFFVNEVLPIIWQIDQDFIFHIVGSKVPDEIRLLAGKRIIVHGFVEDLEPLFDQVKMAVAPLRYGAGIKGKIATAMSVGLPNVVTSVGAEGMGLIDGRDCIIADTPEAIATAVCKLNTDKSLWTQLSFASRRFCENNYGTVAAERIFDSILRAAGAVAEKRAAPRLVSPTGASSLREWPGSLRPMATVRAPVDLANLLASQAWQHAMLRDRYARIRLHDRPELGYPAYCFATGERVILTAGEIATDDKSGSMRRALTCPVTGLDNIDRLVAALATQVISGRGETLKLAAQVESTKLRAWLAQEFAFVRDKQTADLTISDVYRPEIATHIRPGGELISAAVSANAALDAIKYLTDNGWSEASLEVYHSPTYGHLGPDLMVVRAIR